MRVARVLPLALMASAFIASPAEATSGCAYAGATGVISPSMQLQGGAGVFNAFGTYTCPNPPITGNWMLYGSYVNIVCGTFDLYTGTRDYQITAWNGPIYDHGKIVGTAHFAPNTPPGSDCTKEFTWLEQDYDTGVSVTTCSNIICPRSSERSVTRTRAG